MLQTVTNQTVYMPKNLGLSETLLCNIIAPSGKVRTVRALLDGGSQITALKRSVAKDLNLKGVNKTLIVGTSGAQTLEYPNELETCFKLASIDNKFITSFVVEAITIPTPTSDIAPILIDPKKFKHLENLSFSEQLPMKNAPLKVDILIGQPIVAHILKEIILGSSLEEPAAAIYHIGNCLTGSSSSKDKTKKSLFSSVEIHPEPPLDIQNWFSLENLGIENPTDSKLTADQQKAEDLMKAVTYYDKINKCWHTQLLWSDEPIMYTNVKRASVTASRVIKRFSKPENDDAWKSIQSVYDKNLESGITELVSKEDLKKTSNFHYICMSMVFKPDSETTPVRPVFNANLEFGEEKTSFNKKLLEGPNLLQQLPQLMIKFRCHKYVALLDISKLYSRIRLSKKDADYQRFFWSKTKVLPNETRAELKSYRHNRLIFGSKSSPYQAQWILKQHANMFGNKFLLENAYLDDIFVSGTDPEQLLNDLHHLIWVLKQGDFPSQKIISNSEIVLDGLDESVKASPENAKIYGQYWDVKNDKLSFNFKNDINLISKTLTKRQLLSQMMSLYDLLGFAQPFHLKVKLLFQESCKLSLKWDDFLPENLQEKVLKWVHELPLLNNMSINRCFLPTKGGNILFIASFSDASNVGLGVNTYIVSQDINGHRNSELAFCKAKVLPLKQKYTTPRGELAAAELNARAGNYVANALKSVIGHEPQVYYFSDSEITLFRLKGSPTTYKTWVANRLKAIHDQTKVCDWYYVKSEENPSDISSKGAYLSEFIDSDLFFHGPKWLTNPLYQFKVVGETLSDDKISLDNEEIKRLPHPISLFSAIDDEANIIKDVLNRHNNWRKCVNILAWCKRFCTNARLKAKNKIPSRQRRTRLVQKMSPKINYDDLHLHSTEVTAVENLLFKYAQSSQFSKEIVDLKEGREIPKDSKIKKLIPKWDNELELLLHSSRIAGYNPVILPHDHEITRLFIQDVHKKFGHSGPSLTLYKVRKRVWITNGRQQIKKALYKCSCRKTIPLNERMGKIPSWRHENPKIWTCIGTDVLGPFYVKKDPTGIKNDDKIIKTYAILWTDLISRGVMVDLLYSADTAGVIRSLRKLTAIYGAGKTYYSDNASYYKKSSIELKNFMASIDWPAVRRESSKFNADWIFATAASPFRNATSERLVRSIKEALTKVIKKNMLSFSELSVCLLECSSYINNRPIGFLSSDSQEDMRAVTPSLLTIGREIEPLGEYTGKEPKLKELYDYRTKTVTNFLQNWTALYLQDLSPTKKWLEKNPYVIKPGMVLFIKDENKLRDLWSKGIVTKVICSKIDNLPRTIELRTTTGKIVRPIQKLALPEYEIVDPPISNFLNVDISNIAIPEISDAVELKNYLAQN